MKKLNREFYSRDTLEVAKDLLGKYLVRESKGKKIVGKIVETEAYMGTKDKGAHTYSGKVTPRTEAMFGIPGTSYVYLIYGMYNCFNVVTKEEGIPEAVLIRAVEPIEGLEEMSLNRFKKSYIELKKREIRNLTSGPGKLCIALDIDRSLNKTDLCGDNLYIENPDVDERINIVESKRIGIDYAEEAKDYLWRFYIEGNEYVSVK